MNCCFYKEAVTPVTADDVTVSVTSPPLAQEPQPTPLVSHVEHSIAAATALIPLINAPDDVKMKHQNELKAAANEYANAVGMDDLNRKGLEVLLTGDKQAFHKHVFTDVDDKGNERILSYGEMRSRYG
jgi:hypothetical protein